MPRSKKNHNKKKYLIILVALAAILVFACIKPLFQIQSNITLRNYVNPSAKIDWPINGEAAIKVSESDQIISSGNEKPLATASTAKLVTALMVLKKHPLDLNQQGPMINLTQNDVATYSKYVKLDGSVTTVQSGEQISEYQALQAILIPSSCNMSDSLAVWAFGSIDNYINYANANLKQMGINNTTIGGDASGFLPDSKSTPTDLVKIGELALKDPVIASIVSQKNVSLPIDGEVNNYNSLLGKYGYIGIKTGNNDQDKGAFVFAAKNKIAGSNTMATVIGAIMGEDSLGYTLDDSITTVQSAMDNFKIVNYPAVNQSIGYYTVPWSKAHYSFKANGTNKYILWGEKTLTPNVVVSKVNFLSSKDAVIGRVSVNANQQNVTLSEKIPSPSIIWDILNIFNFSK